MWFCRPFDSPWNCPSLPVREECSLRQATKAKWAPLCSARTVDSWPLSSCSLTLYRQRTHQAYMKPTRHKIWVSLSKYRMFTEHCLWNRKPMWNTCNSSHISHWLRITVSNWVFSDFGFKSLGFYKINGNICYFLHDIKYYKLTWNNGLYEK